MTEPKRSLSIAILGTRGVPPIYGGFETMAAELGSRLVRRGHKVTVYCRAALYPDRPATWEGIELIHLPAFRHKYLETVSHTALSALDTLRRDFDAVLLCNAANAFVLPLLRLAKCGTAINVDGIERKRKKWSAAGRLVYLLGEALSVRFADEVIADADTIAAYYAKHHGTQPLVIPYGSEFPDEEDSDILHRLGIEQRRYVLYVSRFEPENHPLEVVESYRKVGSDVPLVLVGAAPYSNQLTAQVRSAANSRVIIPGGVYGIDYRTLQRHSLVYVQATEIGGTHPALIEAMAAGGAVVANDTAENREVGGETIRYFTFEPEETLSSLLNEMLRDPAGLDRLRPLARERARSRYGWEPVTSAYEQIFQRIANRR